MEETPETAIRVLIYGLGAIGCFYGFILQRSPRVSLAVVARSNYQTVKENGFTIKSKNHGEHTVRPDAVLKSTGEATGHFDYVICTAKALDQERNARELKAVIDDKTTIVIIQNGVGNEDAFRAAYPESTIISCVTWVWATQTSPAIVQHYDSEKTELGLFPQTPTHPAATPTTPTTTNMEADDASLQQFASLLATGKTPYQIASNIQLLRWEKIVWNVAWNSLTALTTLDTQSWIGSSEHSLPLTRRVMREVVDVAHSCGVHVDYGLIDRLVDKTVALPGIRSSMLVDSVSGRQMEVEMILGTPVRRARETGLEVPTLDTLYALLLAFNHRLR